MIFNRDASSDIRAKKWVVFGHEGRGGKKKGVQRQGSGKGVQGVSQWTEISIRNKSSRGKRRNRWIE